MTRRLFFFLFLCLSWDGREGSAKPPSLSPRSIRPLEVNLRCQPDYLILILIAPTIPTIIEVWFKVKQPWIGRRSASASGSPSPPSSASDHPSHAMYPSGRNFGRLNRQSVAHRSVTYISHFRTRRWWPSIRRTYVCTGKSSEVLVLAERGAWMEHGALGGLGGGDRIGRCPVLFSLP